MAYIGAKRSALKRYPRRYYVDATLGLDTNAGRSPSLAWQTEAAINGNTNLRRYDRIYFKRGETFALAATITIPADGLYLGAYGTGDNPIIDGQDTVNCITAAGINNIRLENLDLTQGVDHGAIFTGCSAVTVVDCDMHDAGNDNLLFYSNCVNCHVYGGEYYNAAAGAAHCGIEITDGGYDFLIEGVECYSNNEGMSIHNHPTTEMPTNVTVRNSTFRNNLNNGLNVGEDQAHGALTILIEACTSHTNAGDNFAVGYINNYPSGVQLKDCISYGATSENYYIKADDVLLERCISYDNAVALCKGVKVLDSVGVNIYNCSFYHITESWPVIVIDGARADNVKMKNCIQGAGAAIIVMEITAAAVGGGGTFDVNYNLYQANPAASKWKYNGGWVTWANWKTNSGQDAASPTPADPKYVNPATPDFTLQADSPAINAGLVIPGITDGYLGVAPDCGYKEKA